MDDDGRSSSDFFDGETSGFVCGENGSSGESGEFNEGKSEKHFFKILHLLSPNFGPCDVIYQHF